MKKIQKNEYWEPLKKTIILWTQLSYLEKNRKFFYLQGFIVEYWGFVKITYLNYYTMQNPNFISQVKGIKLMLPGASANNLVVLIFQGFPPDHVS